MTLVVATDLGPSATRLTRLAARLAHRRGEPLRLVHVSTDPRAGAVVGTTEDHLLDDARRQLAEAASTLHDLPGLRVETEVCVGPVPEALAAAAERVVATLLLVGDTRRKRSAWRASMLEALARRVRVPLWVLRAPEGVEAWLDGAGPLRVVVGSDLGAASTRALQCVAPLRALGDVDATLVTVVSPAEATAARALPPPLDPDAMPPALTAAITRDLRSQLETAGVADMAVQCLVGEAAPAAHLAVYAASSHSHLVVVGGRPRAWIDTLWHRSVAQAMLHEASTNVLIVPHDLATPPVETAPRFRSALVATDLSELGDRAIPYACALVEGGGVVHVVYVLDAGPLAPRSVVHRDPTLERQLVERVPGDAAARGVAVHAHVLLGRPAEAITALAVQLGVDVICVGSQGRTGLSAAVLGSVARGVIAVAPCPVLVAPRPRA